MDEEHPLIKEAYIFAQKKHSGQNRKYVKEPYFNHPIAVYFNVYSCTNDVNMRAAALLHDTIEDTATTYEEIARHFNKEIADLVQELTNNKEQAESMGKAEYLARKMKRMSDEALLIKLADRLDNVAGLTKLNFEDATQLQFADDYVAQTIYIFEQLDKTLNPMQDILQRQIMEKIDLYIQYRQEFEKSKEKKDEPDKESQNDSNN